MRDKLYDILAIIGRIVVPALGVLYGTLAKIWGLPFGNEIVATLAALTVFINAILEIRSAKYFESHNIVEK